MSGVACGFSARGMWNMSEHDWYGPCDALLPDGCSVCHSAIKIQASDWCSAHREWSPCPDCETEATIARLTRERDEARAEAEEAARAYNDVAADLRRTAAEREEARGRIENIDADERITSDWRAYVTQWEADKIAQAREAALREAAGVCDRMAGEVWPPDCGDMLRDAAKCILSLLAAAPAAEVEP